MKIQPGGVSTLLKKIARKLTSKGVETPDTANVDTIIDNIDTLAENEYAKGKGNMLGSMSFSLYRCAGTAAGGQKLDGISGLHTITITVSASHSAGMPGGTGATIAGRDDAGNWHVLYSGYTYSSYSPLSETKVLDITGYNCLSFYSTSEYNGSHNYFSSASVKVSNAT